MNAIERKETSSIAQSLFQRIYIFGKAQVSAFVGGVIDYLVMIAFTEFFHVHYTISICIGGFVGALVNFSLNKNWTFHSKDKRYKHSVKVQLIKFSLMALNSILLKSSGTYLVTRFLRIDYKFSRLIVDLIVSIGINYNLQRFWVFKQERKA
jgi:putative flippase GtrA